MKIDLKKFDLYLKIVIGLTVIVGAIFAFERTSLDGNDTVTVIANVSAYTPSIDLGLILSNSIEDLISGRKFSNKQIKMKPYQVLWFAS